MPIEAFRACRHVQAERKTVAIQGLTRISAYAPDNEFVLQNGLRALSCRPDSYRRRKGMIVQSAACRIHSAENDAE